MKEEHSVDIVTYDNRKHRQAVITIWRSVFDYRTDRNDPAFAIDQKLAVGDGLFWVALSRGAVVGTIMAGYDGHRGWIYSMAVKESHRHLGIGTLLLRHAEEKLAQRGCVKVNLQILAGNAAVQRFYVTNGYTQEERISMGKQIHENMSNLD